MKQPLHDRIRSDYEARILSGALLPGARLPTELELMRDYACSRMTVNKALSALTAAGLIDRRKRAGTFVARPRVHSMVLDVPDLEQEVAQRGQRYRYDLLRREVRMPDPGTAEETLLAGAGPLLVLDGVHHADDVPLASEQRLISLSAVPETEGVDFAGASPGAWLLKHVPWTQAETRIAAVGADRAVAAGLNLLPGSPCLLIERRTWRGDDGITLVRQHFVGSAYDLIATFGPAKG
ncbi:GntR family histidine utilization transcriptional repressor [Sphingopyxis panaciterrae]|uniref:histidine utilization repressor n=1 Tax=Sphingopyxis panaciterrae TaxID=363841 RepID=UPI001420AF91|nr:GntR family histidine utilization transcriptional repressor [Sphingopyxis panaciterrae]